MWEKSDGEIVLAGGWGMCGEGKRMSVPVVCLEPQMERKAAEVDWMRLGGVKGAAVDAWGGM